MQKFQEGDAAAFERLVILYQSSVLHFLYRYLRDRDRAEDLTQEVFVRVFRSKNRYRPTATFRTWLFTIASRLALNEIRALRRRRRVFAEVHDAEESTAGDEPWTQAPDCREPPPAARLEQTELEEVVSQLIEELPANQRMAVLLGRMEEMSYREIAAALGVSTMAVKSLLMRARETLRARLERYMNGKPLSPGRNS